MLFGFGKGAFPLVGSDKEGRRVPYLQIKRRSFTPEFGKMPHCNLGMESRLGARFVGRTLRRLWFGPRLIPSFQGRAHYIE